MKNKLTILGKSDGFLTSIFNNLSTTYFIPDVFIINNLNLPIEYPFNHPKINYTILTELSDYNSEFFIGVYSPQPKKIIYNEFKIDNSKFTNIIHSSSEIDETVKIGTGCLINALSRICPHTKIGNFVSINNRVLIGHHCNIGDFVTISPGCNITGHCEIGEGSYIGVGTSIVPKIKIGKNSVIGAGSVVTRDIPDNVVAYGSPCKVIRENI
jgi:sugar O-acyltransferase (sialic acid O-acetyltransferase NeuD family)